MYQKEIDLIRAVKTIDHQSLKPIPGENVRSWIERCEAYLIAVIVPQDVSFDGAERFAEIMKIIEGQ